MRTNVSDFREATGLSRQVQERGVAAEYLLSSDTLGRYCVSFDYVSHLKRQKVVFSIHLVAFFCVVRKVCARMFSFLAFCEVAHMKDVLPAVRD